MSCVCVWCVHAGSPRAVVLYPLLVSLEHHVGFVWFLCLFVACAVDAPSHCPPFPVFHCREILIYYPVAHWVWGMGWLGKMGVLDFAGGIVLHTTAGSSALVIALLLGPRHDFKETHGHYLPSNIPLAAIGTGMLWAGWFG